MSNGGIIYISEALFERGKSCVASTGDKQMYYDNFLKLVNAMEASDAELVRPLFLSFLEYSKKVNEYVILGELAKKTMTGEDLRLELESLDRKRHNAHESAIGSLNALNRLCGMMKLGKFADIDTTNRYNVADFIGEFVNEFYTGEIARTKGAHQ